VAYRFIEKHQRKFGIHWLLKRMGIFPNAYYNYLKQAKAIYYARKNEICRKIKDTYHEFGGILGYRSMRIFLAREHIFLSKTTVHKYMNKELHLQYVCRRKHPGSKKGHAHKIFPNLLNRSFVADKANKVWCTDFTYVFLTNGSLRYNCTMIDLYDRSVIASETGKWITSDLAIRTLEKALHSQKKKPRNLILHSDQGSQFTSIQFISYCQKHGITQSMSAAGCPYDNAPMERYYNTFKAELIHRFNFRTDEELTYAVSEYAYVWYNQIRPHSYNDYRTPYETKYGLSQFRQQCYKNA
jgi:putative transposase